MFNKILFIRNRFQFSHREIYTWESVTCTVHNIVVGRLWFEYVSLEKLKAQPFDFD